MRRHSTVTPSTASSAGTASDPHVREAHTRLGGVLHAVWLALLLVSFVAVAATAVAATAAPGHGALP